MNVMVRKALLDEIAEAAREQAIIDYEGMNVDDLVGAKKVGSRIMVDQGGSSKAMTFNAVNLISVGLWDPEWLAGQFDERAEDFWFQYWQEDDPSTHPRIKTELEDEQEGETEAYGKYGLNKRIRSRELLEFWSRLICDVEKNDVDEDHHKRYYAQLYVSLMAGNHRKVGVGALPWADRKRRDAIVVGRIPKWIYPMDPEEMEQDDEDTNSAAEADW
jgi:hypothetical protein